MSKKNGSFFPSFFYCLSNKMPLTAIRLVAVIPAVVLVVALGARVHALVSRRAPELVEVTRQRLSRTVLLILARPTV